MDVISDIIDIEDIRDITDIMDYPHPTGSPSHEQ